MNRSHVKYQAFSREQLREELIERCRRLRWPRRGVAGGTASDTALPGIRCRLTRERADSDWPSLLEAERGTHLLLSALHEVAALLGRFDRLERGQRSGTRLPS